MLNATMLLPFAHCHHPGKGICVLLVSVSSAGFRRVIRSKLTAGPDDLRGLFLPK